MDKPIVACNDNAHAFNYGRGRTDRHVNLLANFLVVETKPLEPSHDRLAPPQNGPVIHSLAKERFQRFVPECRESIHSLTLRCLRVTEMRPQARPIKKCQGSRSEAPTCDRKEGRFEVKNGVI